MSPSYAPRLGAAAAFAAFVAVAAPHAFADDAVVAKVNGKDITESDLSLAEADLGNEIGTLPPATKRRVLVEYMIETKLFAEAAEGAQLASGPDFDKRMAYWRQRALRDAFYDKNVKATISDGLAKGFYDDRVKMLPPEEEVQARHILVESEEKAKELAEKINGGGDFAQLAKENSKDPGSKAEGGMLGYFGRGQMIPEFEQVAFSLKPGEMSKPVKSQFGWHLIRLEDRRTKLPPSFEEVKDRIVGSLVQTKAQDVAKELRGKANVEYIDAEVKKQAEADAAQAAAQQKAFEAQMQQQIDKMEAEGKK